MPGKENFEKAKFYIGLINNGCYDIRQHEDGTYTCLYPYLFTAAILRGRELSPDILDRWCYPDALQAHAALWTWDGMTGEPAGWIKHPATNRCRPNGDPARESIGWPVPTDLEDVAP